MVRMSICVECALLVWFAYAIVCVYLCLYRMGVFVVNLNVLCYGFCVSVLNQICWYCWHVPVLNALCWNGLCVCRYALCVQLFEVFFWYGLYMLLLMNVSVSTVCVCCC